MFKVTAVVSCGTKGNEWDFTDFIVATFQYVYSNTTAHIYKMRTSVILCSQVFVMMNVAVSLYNGI